MASLPGNELTRRDLEAMPGFGLSYELDDGAIWISSDRRLTAADLEVIADDLRRYELLDGEILVTAAPGDRHQAIVVNLIVLLKAACPSDLRVRKKQIEAALTARRLEKGRNAEVAAIVGGDAWSADEPLPCSVVPESLVD